MTMMKINKTPISYYMTFTTLCILIRLSVQAADSKWKAIVFIFGAQVSQKKV